MAAAEANIRVRSREGEEITWSRKAARRSGEIKDQMDIKDQRDSTVPEDGVFLAPTVEAESLRTMGALLEAEGDAAADAELANENAAGVLHFIQQAAYLDAAPAMESAKRVLRRLLDGKRSEELRELLGEAEDAAPERAAAIREPAFALPAAGGAVDADDVRITALAEAATATVIELKGVSGVGRDSAARALPAGVLAAAPSSRAGRRA